MSAVRMDHVRYYAEKLMSPSLSGDDVSQLMQQAGDSFSAFSERLLAGNFNSSEDGLLSLSLGVASSRGEVLHAAAIGRRDPQNNPQEEVGTDALYNIGSISKFILMILTLQLIQQNRLCFNTTVADCLPDIAIPNKKTITIEHLLAHRSGLKDCGFIMLKENDPVTNLLAKKADQSPDLAGLPGAAFYYANLNYVIIAHIIQACMQKNLQACFEALIANKLHIQHTGVIDQFKPTSPVTAGYKFILDSSDELPGLTESTGTYMFGATGFQSTPADLTKIMIHFFNNDDFIQPHLRQKVLNSISEETFEVITQTQVHRWPTKTGLGIERREVVVDGVDMTIYCHGGWQDGHAAFLAYSPVNHQAYCACVSKTQDLHLLKRGVAYQNNAIFKGPSDYQSEDFRSKGLGPRH
ncbi:MAG TPA: serine hydrolase domain-containing protein [Gammaproteobacteria bacterium]|jgi:CubicO group peptidase (beta-lactamase class C family)|nr:serine hydrolase domain-containing protein [Gammaproteobacteria bacterium]